MQRRAAGLEMEGQGSEARLSVLNGKSREALLSTSIHPSPACTAVHPGELE